jgi:hypothetical protein
MRGGVGIFLLLTLLLALPASATITTSALTGRVTVGSAPAAGVTVTATSPSLQHPRTTITGARGSYFLDSLPPGNYEVTFALAGHTSLIRKAKVELARVGRADAKIERSEDEETVTSTATTISVGDTTAITTHFDDALLDRLPIHRDAISATSVSPGAFVVSQGTIDDFPLAASSLFGQDALEETTILHAALPVEYERTLGSTIVARTRSGGEKRSLTLRDNVTSRGGISGAVHRLELNAGGRIVPERLWFFAAGWRGDEADLHRDDQRGYLIKLTSQLGPSHNVVVTHNDAETRDGPVALDFAGTFLHYTGVHAPRVTSDVVASRSDTSLNREDFVAMRSSVFLGDHVLAAGGSARDHREADAWSLFASDRWSVARWTVYAGVRHARTEIGDQTTTRAAVTYDIRGNGRHAIAASYGEYEEERESSIGYLAALGSSGTARIHLLRTDGIDRAQVEARYRLFDRFEIGGNYAYADAVLEHIGNAWVSLEMPIGDHEFGVTVLQRYREWSMTALPTDVGLRYTIPLGVTFALDATNVFAHGKLPDSVPRALRLWVRWRV